MMPVLMMPALMTLNRTETETAIYTLDFCYLGDDTQANDASVNGAGVNGIELIKFRPHQHMVIYAYMYVLSHINSQQCLYGMIYIYTYVTMGQTI